MVPGNKPTTTERVRMCRKESGKLLAFQEGKSAVKERGSVRKIKNACVHNPAHSLPDIKPSAQWFRQIKLQLFGQGRPRNPYCREGDIQGATGLSDPSSCCQNNRGSEKRSELPPPFMSHGPLQFSEPNYVRFQSDSYLRV